MAVPVINNATENPTSNFKYGVINLTLENQMIPLEKIDQTPSRIDGLDKDIENDLRFYGCNLIQKYGIMLKLPQVAMATGQILFQRFYYAKSFIKHPFDIYAMGCLCAASKIEESPRRIRDVINVYFHERQLRYKKPITSMPLDGNYTALKQNVIKAERRVLRELGFCVHVQHAHKFIITLLKLMELINKDLAQFAWNLMNDSLRTNVFLLYPPEQVAAACIHLSSLIQNIPLPKIVDEWYSILNLNDEEVGKISKLILSAYTNVKPNVEAAEAKVEELRIKQELARSKAKLLAGDPLLSTNHLSNFSPNSKTTSPKNNDTKKESSSKESSQRYKRSRSRSRSASLTPRKRRRHSVSSRSRSSSQSPKYRGKTPPRSYKDHHRSRHRETYSRHHKSRKSRSYSRSASPINHHSTNYRSSSNKRSNYKDKNYSSKSHHHHENRNSSYSDYKPSSHHKSSKKERSTKDTNRHSRSSPHRDRRR